MEMEEQNRAYMNGKQKEPATMTLNQLVTVPRLQRGHRSLLRDRTFSPMSKLFVLSAIDHISSIVSTASCCQRTKSLLAAVDDK